MVLEAWIVIFGNNSLAVESSEINVRRTKVLRRAAAGVSVA
jgi:hypothetical protein